VNAPANAFNHIIQQMADNASFLWVLRNRQTREPHVYPEHIAELDGRIQANLDGLLLYGEEAWGIAQANGEFPQGGEAFCLGVLAFSSDDVTKIQYATEFALQNEDTFKGLVSALAWLPGPKIHPWITQFFHSKNLEHKRLALAVCRVRREDPAGYLTQIFEREDCLNHARLLAEALRAVGFFNRAEFATHIKPFFAHPDPNIIFWAVYASLRLGNSAPAELLIPYCTAVDEAFKPLQPKAQLLAMRYLPLDVARSWIGQWVEQGFLRTAIQACGFLGDATSIPWLISQMNCADLNRISGEAFYLITGLKGPDGPVLSSDEKSEEIDISEDESLSWVDAQKISSLQISVNKSAGLLQMLRAKKPTQSLAMKYQLMLAFIGD
jgi:uncharacterized protein (TIGR02270 family)